LKRLPRDEREYARWVKALNEQSLSADGLPTERGSFVAELTGFTTTVEPTIEYQILSPMVFLWLDTNTFATSNSTGMSLTGVPAALRPPTSRQGMTLARDNGAGQVARQSLGSTGIIIFDLSPYTGGGFTASGSKGLFAGWTHVYAIDP
jgi:hypothetical protein